MAEYVDKIATLDALEKEKQKAESRVLENTHSIIKDSSNCGRLFGVSDSQKIVYDIPTADVVERDKIKQAIEEIEQTLYVDSLIFGELIDFKDGKISADDVIEEFNRVTRKEVLEIIDKHISGKE